MRSPPRVRCSRSFTTRTVTISASWPRNRACRDARAPTARSSSGWRTRRSRPVAMPGRRSPTSTCSPFRSGHVTARSASSHSGRSAPVRHGSRRCSCSGSARAPRSRSTTRCSTSRSATSPTRCSWVSSAGTSSRRPGPRSRRLTGPAPPRSRSAATGTTHSCFPTGAWPSSWATSLATGSRRRSRWGSSAGWGGRARTARAPREVVMRLDALVDTLPEAGMATLAYAVLETWSGELTYACAGHPTARRLREEGAAAALAGAHLPTGLLLGLVRGGGERPAGGGRHARALHRRARRAAHRGDRRGARRLVASARDAPPNAPPELVDHLLRAGPPRGRAGRRRVRPRRAASGA